MTYADYNHKHACNYASRHKVNMCRRPVTDGERYCWQHRPRNKETT